MKTKSSFASLPFLFLMLLSFNCHAVIMTFDNQAGFLGAVGPATTYDFERGSGFPADTNGGALGGFAPIGVFDGINFNAATYQTGNSTSGLQSMTGIGGTFTSATLTFSPGTKGLGFFGLDLTANEIIKLTVDFAIGPDQVYDISLNGDPALTPQYFGLWDSTDSILSASLRGTEIIDQAKLRAWAIDDLSVAVSPVPVPAAVWLFGTALAGFIGFSRRRNVA